MVAEPMISEDEQLPEPTEEEIAEAEELIAAEAAAEAARLASLDSLARSIESKFFECAQRRKSKESEWRKSTTLCRDMQPALCHEREQTNRFE